MHKMGLNMLLDIIILDYNALSPIQAKSCSRWQLSQADYLLSLPFLSIILAEKLTGSNFTNWYRNLRIVLWYEKKIKFAGPPDPETTDPDTIDTYYESVNLEQEVACLMLSIDRGGDGGDVVWWQRGGVGWGGVAMMVTRWRQRGEGRDGNGGCEGSGGKERWR
ncbi:hypothetical protein Tco_0771467 [Tanacetum coccineum]|uniref:Retrotransposon Copia-like N-terminal domain-containing protein n=1 Tax=Tanacetum coccineum TaxID=301880 RepID=A0ABQ4ZHQ7_9ASTR